MDVKIKAKEFSDTVSFTATVDDRGRITIPASVRRTIHAKFCTRVMVIAKKMEEMPD